MYCLVTSVFLVMDDMSVFSDDEGWENGVDLVESLEKAWNVYNSHIAEIHE